VFVLHDVEGYKHQEIAELTGVATGTSKAQLHRAGAAAGGVDAMTCDEARDRMDDYVDGTLDEAAFQEMELHVATCAECRSRSARSARSSPTPRRCRPSSCRPATCGRGSPSGWTRRLLVAAPRVVGGMGRGPRRRRRPRPRLSFGPARAGRGARLSTGASVAPAGATERGSGRVRGAGVRAGRGRAPFRARAAARPPAAETLASVEKDLRSIDARCRKCGGPWPPTAEPPVSTIC